VTGLAKDLFLTFLAVEVAPALISVVSVSVALPVILPQNLVPLVR
jgi:hypothetical protein